jgi:endonuclease-3
MLEELFPESGMILNYGSPWELVVAVQLSAQCTDVMVNRVTDKLFKKYLTLEEYVNADPREFEKDIFKSGYYRSKTKNILQAARMVQEVFGGVVPNTMEEILKLPGVARKTANVVLGNAYGVFDGIAVDTHVRRFAISFDLSDSTDPKKIEQDLMKIIPQKDWFRFTYLVIEYGRQIAPSQGRRVEDPLLSVYPTAETRWQHFKKVGRL